MDGAAKASDRAILPACELDLLDVVTAVGRGDVPFAACLGPLDRETELFRAEDRDEIARVRGDLTPKTPTDLWGDDPELVFGAAYRNSRVWQFWAELPATSGGT